MPVSQVTGHGSGLYRFGPHANHTIRSTNSASAREMNPRCQNFYPRPLRPWFFLSCVKRSTCAETREHASSFPIIQRYRKRLAFNFPDGTNGCFYSLAVRVPERGELRLVHVVELLPEIRECCLELFAVRCRAQDAAQIANHGVGSALGCKQPNPKIIFDVIAALLESRYGGKRIRALAAEQRE